MTNSVNILCSPGLGNLCLSNTAHLFGGKIIMSLCFGDILTKTCIEFVFFVQTFNYFYISLLPILWFSKLENTLYHQDMD